MLIVILISPAIILSLSVFVLILNAIFKIISLVKPKTVLEVSKGIQSINLILLQIGLLILELLLLAFLMPMVLKASLTVILGIIIIGLILTIMFSVIWLLGELIVKLNVYKNMITVLILTVLMMAVVTSFLILALLLLITQQIAAKLDIVTILLFLGGLLLLTIAVLAIGYLALSVSAYLMPAVAGVLILVFSIGIIVAAVLVIAQMLYVLQFLELDQEKIAENVSKVIGAAMMVISSIFAPKEDEEGGGESKSWFASVIEMAGGAILTILQAVLAVYFLALTLVAISLILFMALELRLLQDINLDTNAINANVHLVIDTAKMVINALFEPQDEKEDAQSLKIQRIQDILYEGLEVIHIIHRWGMTETEALLVESALMDAYPGLTNIQGGYHCDNGVVSTHSLQKRFESEVFVDRDDIKYLIIKIRKSVIEDRGSVYEAVRRAWKISIDNAQNYPYVLAVENGIVKGVFEVDYWYKSQEIGRCEFIGKNAHKEIEDYFLNKRIPEKYCKKVCHHLFCMVKIKLIPNLGQ
jgi:hypothetical protein